MRALVTGCAGFIGSHLAEAILRDGDAVLGVDCFNDNYARPQKLANLKYLTTWDEFEFVPIDLSHGDLVDLVQSVDVVFHLAAEPGVRSSWGARYEKYLRNNLLATQHILDALLTCPGTRLVFASSSSVYGDAEVFPTPESAQLRPRSPYGQTKAAAEQICDLYRANHGLDVVGLRYFTVFGPRQRPDMAFYRLLAAGIRGEEFTMFGDGSQSRDFTFVSDVVAVTRSAGQAQLGEERVFNVGGGSPATLAEAVQIVEEVVGRPLNLVVAGNESGDVRDTAADTTQASNLLGFAPSVSLRSGLEAQHEWIERWLDI